MVSQACHVHNFRGAPSRGLSYRNFNCSEVSLLVLSSAIPGCYEQFPRGEVSFPDCSNWSVEIWCRSTIFRVLWSISEVWGLTKHFRAYHRQCLRAVAIHSPWRAYSRRYFSACRVLMKTRSRCHSCHSIQGFSLPTTGKETLEKDLIRERETLGSRETLPQKSKDQHLVDETREWITLRILDRLFRFSTLSTFVYWVNQGTYSSVFWTHISFHGNVVFSDKNACFHSVVSKPMFHINRMQSPGLKNCYCLHQSWNRLSRASMNKWESQLWYFTNIIDKTKLNRLPGDFLTTVSLLLRLREG